MSNILYNYTNNLYFLFTREKSILFLHTMLKELGSHLKPCNPYHAIDLANNSAVPINFVVYTVSISLKKVT